MWPKVELRWSMPVPPTVNDVPGKREDDSTRATGATGVPPIIRGDGDSATIDLHLTISFDSVPPRIESNAGLLPETTSGDGEVTS